jgi:hypothetical protein
MQLCEQQNIAHDYVIRVQRFHQSVHTRNDTQPFHVGTSLPPSISTCPRHSQSSVHALKNEDLILLIKHLASGLSL